MNYPTAEQRGINRNIHNRPKGLGINKPKAYETPVRRVYGGLISGRLKYKIMILYIFWK